ncbi:hypothetical protein D9757_005070 [Collybiopsis confluens]|uniref:Uncharacterized protein n=1 Tax=Collybiopsis confluens TaxID=2823264 RepID=A0A8H5HSU5_9AGAR|nr:hypothetical protein D9757_005070 [Collybiopsis confluens]
MPFRAYVLREDLSVDTSRPVALETLDALGWKIVSFANIQDAEEAAKKMTQDHGFPLTPESFGIPFDFRLGAPDLSPIIHANKIILGQNKLFGVGLDSFGLLRSGTIFCDIEDVVSKNWIRVDLGPGQLFRIPAGAKCRMPWNNKPDEVPVGLWFLNGDLSDAKAMEEKELDASPLRRAYLSGVKAI